jgi:hypothetical protein
MDGTYSHYLHHYTSFTMSVNTDNAGSDEVASFRGNFHKCGLRRLLPTCR